MAEQLTTEQKAFGWKWTPATALSVAIPGSILATLGIVTWFNTPFSPQKKLDADVQFSSFELPIRKTLSDKIPQECEEAVKTLAKNYDTLASCSGVIKVRLTNQGTAAIENIRLLRKGTFHCFPAPEDASGISLRSAKDSLPIGILDVGQSREFSLYTSTPSVFDSLTVAHDAGAVKSSAFGMPSLWNAFFPGFFFGGFGIMVGFSLCLRMFSDRILGPAKRRERPAEVRSA